MISIGAVAAIRAETAAAHLALEHSDLVMPSTRDLLRYRRLIAAMAGFHATVECEQMRYEPAFRTAGIDLSRARKAGTLRHECMLLGCRPTEAPAFALTSFEEAAGSHYVLEGSTLGGLGIAKAIESNLNVRSRYYGCYGRETATRWRDTVRALEGVPADTDALDAMILGAKRTFTALQTHLERWVRDSNGAPQAAPQTL